jgi:hypothetical protein
MSADNPLYWRLILSRLPALLPRILPARKYVHTLIRCATCAGPTGRSTASSALRQISASGSSTTWRPSRPRLRLSTTAIRTWQKWERPRDDSPTPHEHFIRIIGDFSAPHAWELVEHTSGRIQARISQHFLETSAFSKCGMVTFGHKSRTETYPMVKMVNPAVWSLLKSGVVAAHGQLVSVTLLATQRERLRTLPSHPFSTWQRGIEGLVACIPSDDGKDPRRPRQGRHTEQAEQRGRGTRQQVNTVSIDLASALEAATIPST